MNDKRSTDPTPSNDDLRRAEDAVRPALEGIASLSRGEIRESFFIGLRARAKMVQEREAKGRRRELPEWLTALGRWPMPAYGGAMVLLLALMLNFLLSPTVDKTPLGTVVYTAGRMDVEQAGRTSEAQQHMVLGRSTGLATADGGHGALYLPEREALWYVQSQTRAKLVSFNEVELLDGASWFDVRPGKGDFTVTTPHGTVRVLGTSFGVIVTSEGLRVAVAGGAVSVDGVTLRAGFETGVAGGAVGEPSPRREGVLPPAWVTELADKIDTSSFANWYPSVQQAQPREVD